MMRLSNNNSIRFAWNRWLGLTQFWMILEITMATTTRMETVPTAFVPSPSVRTPRFADFPKSHVLPRRRPRRDGVHSNDNDNGLLLDVTTSLTLRSSRSSTALHSVSSSSSSGGSSGSSSKSNSNNIGGSSTALQVATTSEVVTTVGGLLDYTRESIATTTTIDDIILEEESLLGDETTEDSIALWKLALAGSLATLVADIPMHPIDCIKTVQQSDMGMDLSLWEAAKLLYTTSDGIGGFTHGLWTYAFSDAIGGAFKFATYESCYQSLQNQVAGNNNNKNKGEISPLLSCGIVLASAAVAFVASSVVTVPGEFLKQQLQMSYYDSLSQAIATTLQKEGLQGLFAGYDGVLLRDIPYTMLELGSYQFIQQLLSSSSQEQQQLPQLTQLQSQLPEMDETSLLEPVEGTKSVVDNGTMQQIVAAAFTGAIAGFCTTPLDTIKTKLMVDDYSGYYDCLATTIHTHGWESLFASGFARIAWLVPYTVLYLPTYDYLKRQFSQQK